VEYLTTETILDHEFDIYGDVDEPWFLATQVAEAINYGRNDMDKLMRLVYKEDKTLIRISSQKKVRGTSRGQGVGGGNPNKWMINEDGFFDILMRSNVPIARDLRYELRIFLKELRRRGRLTSVSRLHDDIDWILGNCDRSLKEIVGGED